MYFISSYGFEELLFFLGEKRRNPLCLERYYVH